MGLTSEFLTYPGKGGYLKPTRALHYKSKSEEENQRSENSKVLFRCEIWAVPRVTYPWEETGATPRGSESRERPATLSHVCAASAPSPENGMNERTEQEVQSQEETETVVHFEFN